MQEIHQQVQTAHSDRLQQLDDVNRLFSSSFSKSTLATAGLNADRVKSLVPHLDDDELARLAQRTRAIERDVQAGALDNQQLTYIVIALATAVVVILLT